MSIDLKALRLLANDSLDGEPGAWDELIHAELHDGGRVLALIEVVEAAQSLIAEVPDGFDTGPGQDRVDAVFARLTAALAPFKETP